MGSIFSFAPLLAMLIAGNWKMHLTLDPATALARAVTEAIAPLCPSEAEVTVALCTPFPFLHAVAQAVAGSGVCVGAQDVSVHAEGAYTGETSAAMLASVGCTYAIVGHSERRQYHGETDVLVADKAAAALAHGLTPIVCVGETLDERRADRVEAVVGRQLDAVARRLGDDLARAVIAYEPVWAIGTGETATPEQAQEVHAFVRYRLAEALGTGPADAVPILYGGSMKPSNAADLLAQPDVDGGLVGGASLDAASFAALVAAAVATAA